MKSYQKKQCEAIANHYGMENQLPIVIEEMSELTKEICKHIRGNDNLLDLIEEAADVQIMVEQLKFMFDIHTQVDEMVDYKLDRQLRRIEKERGRTNGIRS